MLSKVQSDVVKVRADELTQGDIIKHFTGEIWEVYTEPKYTQRGMVFDVMPLDSNTLKTFEVTFALGWRFELIGHQTLDIAKSSDSEVYYLAQQVCNSEPENYCQELFYPEILYPTKEFTIQLETHETDDEGYSWLHNLKVWANSEKEALEELFLFHTELLKTHNFVGIFECGTDYEF